MVNVIADVAGNFKTLMALLDKMPKQETIFLGDLVDRGPRSKEVLDFVMHNGHKCVLANHEHMMLDHFRGPKYYGSGVWLWNGGSKTLESMAGVSIEPYLEWIESLPKYIELELNGTKFLLSHSFARADMTLEEVCDLGRCVDDFPKSENSIIWCRFEPERRDDCDIQIAGHNSQFGLRRWADDRGEYAICLDDSKEKVLTGIDLNTMEVYQHGYIDKEHL